MVIAALLAKDMDSILIEGGSAYACFILVLFESSNMLPNRQPHHKNMHEWPSIGFSETVGTILEPLGSIPGVYE